MHSYNITEKGSPLHKAKNALILVHGRGGGARDILSLADIFTDEKWYIAAPQVTNNTWYPYSFMVPTERNEPWLGSAIDILHKLLQNVLNTLPSENIYLSNSDNDPHIPESHSLETQSQMQKMGANVKLDIFPDRPHTIIEQEIDRAKRLVFKNGD
jgi:predicted esterase